MANNRCLYCYQELSGSGQDFHEKCSLLFFGTPTPPVLDYDNAEMQQLAKEIVIRSVAVTGVQPKLSLTVEPIPGDPTHWRFTIVGLWGSFILKPPTPEFEHLPENEDLTMHLAHHFNIRTAHHSLIRLKSGELAYITKRFDREDGKKLAVEDMCQLTETLTANKYRSSIEKVAKTARGFVSSPGLSMLELFENTLFSFLTGNADMHLKNFSLITTSEGDIRWAPAYDLLCTKIAMPADEDESALTINGKRRWLKRADFDILAKTIGIPQKSAYNIYNSFSKKILSAPAVIASSFLPRKVKKLYENMLKERSTVIGL